MVQKDDHSLLVLQDEGVHNLKKYTDYSKILKRTFSETANPFWTLIIKVFGSRSNFFLSGSDLNDL